MSIDFNSQLSPFVYSFRLKLGLHQRWKEVNIAKRWYCHFLGLLQQITTECLETTEKCQTVLEAEGLKGRCCSGPHLCSEYLGKNLFWPLLAFSGYGNLSCSLTYECIILSSCNLWVLVYFFLGVCVQISLIL